MSKKYNITRENLPAHEWIGLTAKIVESTDRTHKGIRGKVIDETKQLLILETAKGIKKIVKKGIQVQFQLEGNRKAVVDCSYLTERPEDRIKIFYKKFYKKVDLVN